MEARTAPRISVADWDAFYEENRTKLAMPKAQNYPLDERALIAWASAQPVGHPFRDFAMRIAQHLIYVSYDAFVRALEACLVEALTEYGTQDVCIMLTGEEGSFDTEVGKSQTWVALLGYGMLKRRGVTITAVFGGLFDFYAWFAENERRPTLLVFDDAVYSGSQLGSALSYLMPDEVRDAPSRAPVRAHLTPRTVLVVPYMSAEGRTAIALKADTTNRYWLVVGATDLYYVPAAPPLTLKSTTRIPMVAFNGVKQGAIYFDHKLADKLSVGTLALATPVVALGSSDLTAPPSGGCVPFIRGCEHEQCHNASLIDPRTLRLTDGPAKTLGKRGAKKLSPVSIERCPAAFYKGIEWTYRGARVGLRESIFQMLTGARYPHEAPNIFPESHPAPKSITACLLGDEQRRPRCAVCQTRAAYYVCRHGDKRTYLCGARCAVQHSHAVHQ